LPPQRSSEATSLRAASGAAADDVGRNLFDAFYDAVFPIVYAYAYRVGGDTAAAEELTTLAWEAIVRELPRRELDGDVARWLFGVVRGALAGRARRTPGAEAGAAPAAPRPAQAPVGSPARMLSSKRSTS